MSGNQQGVQSRSITDIAQTYVTVTDSSVIGNTADWMIATQLNNGNAGIYSRRNTVVNSGNADLRVTPGTFGLIDDNYVLTVLTESGGTLATRDNNTVSSWAIFGTLTHSTPQ